MVPPLQVAPLSVLVLASLAAMSEAAWLVSLAVGLAAVAIG